MTVQSKESAHLESDLAGTDLAGIRNVAIDDMIEYVYEQPRATLISYLELYNRYLKQRWDVNELDFSQDVSDWQEMSEAARQSFLQIASGFHHGERQVEVELAPLFFGIPENYKIFLTSHLEDEARHTVFFDRFYREVVGIEGETIMDVLDGSYQYVSETFVGPFGLLSYLTEQLRLDPYDKRVQMQYATTYMMWIEGVLALAVMKITLNYARNNNILPAYYTGFTATCRDEARHVQGGFKFMRDLLDEDPSLVDEVYDTLDTLMIMGSTSSVYVAYEPLGWDEDEVRQIMGRQLRRGLALVGIPITDHLEGRLANLDPVLAGG